MGRTSPPERLVIAAAIVRRGADVLLVRQAGPGEEPFWSTPGGRAEPGELVTEALVRELREETGLRVSSPALAFLAQVDNRQDGWFATVWIFEALEWEGDPAAADPDGFVLEAAWVPLPEASARLERVPWHRLTARYLRGELEPRSLWLRRVDETGCETLEGPL